jgi:hypothetical protein
MSFPLVGLWLLCVARVTKELPLVGLCVTVPNTKRCFSTYLGYSSVANNMRGVDFGLLGTF